MSDIAFSCPECLGHLVVEAQAAGSVVNCPHCSKKIKIPQAKTATVEAQPAAPIEDKQHKDCPFCGEQILARAIKCKHCGEFLDEVLRKQQLKQSTPIPAPALPAPILPVSQLPDVEKTEYESHPSMFGSNPVMFIGFLVMCLFLIGFLLFFLWWLNTLETTLTVTTKRTVLRRGILAKSTTEVRHRDVRNIQISQSVFQRMAGVGTIGISSAAQSDIEIVAQGMPNPQKVKQIIDKYRT